MPNKYSHALVLSHYESKGFIALPRRPLSPRPVSHISHSYRRNNGSSQSAATPPLNAVPGLTCDSSTTSTASSVNDVPLRPLHSAPSSVLTQVYAPQSPSFPADEPSTLPEADLMQKEPSLPPRLGKQPPLDAPPQPPLSTSRFSSFHYFSALFNPSPPERQKKRSRRHQHGTPSEQIAHPAPPTVTSKPRITQLRPASSASRPPTRSQHTPYKRLQPVFSTESLASLSLADLEGPEPRLPPFPKEEIVPWEYPPPQPPRPEPHKPRGFSVDHSRAEERAYKTGRWGADTQSLTVAFDAYIRAEKTSPSQAKSPQLLDIPARQSSVSDQQRLDLDPSNDPVFTPIFSDELLDFPIPAPYRQPLSPSSSFDSVAPPPIRKGPREATALQDARGGRQRLGGASGKAQRSSGKTRRRSGGRGYAGMEFAGELNEIRVA
ncbi:MAG: hypothetical protein Q9208_000748 [Pyrenodesmia sp. 3 TL-2023]